jgi:hypothetical protein
MSSLYDGWHDGSLCAQILGSCSFFVFGVPTMFPDQVMIDQGRVLSILFQEITAEMREKMDNG